MKVLKAAAVILIVSAAVLIIVRGLSGEDDWICQNGSWVMHGKPRAAKPTNPCPGTVQIKKGTMKLTSSVFADNAAIPKVYSCDGKSIHPPFSFSGVGADTKSLALIVDDPDAPIGTFTHWVVWNIPPDTEEIAEGAMPVGSAEGINGAGKVGFVGPCPPNGTHHYIFHLYALDKTLTLTAKAGKSELETAMTGHILEATKLTGLYHR